MSRLGPNVGHLGYRAVVMTLDEARSHIGSGVLYCTAADEAQHAVIACPADLRELVLAIAVGDRWRAGRHRAVAGDCPN